MNETKLQLTKTKWRQNYVTKSNSKSGDKIKKQTHIVKVFVFVFVSACW